MDESPAPPTREALAAQRDARLRHARTITRWAAGAAVVLAAAFAGLAAQAKPGHQRSSAAASSAAPAPARPTEDPGTAPPSAPVQPPAVTQAPPVAQSGGS